MIERIRRLLLESDREFSEDEVVSLIEDIVLESNLELSLEEYERVIHRIYAKLRSKMGIISLYLGDEQVNEIMINGPDCMFFETRQGIRKVDDAFDSVEELEKLFL